MLQELGQPVVDDDGFTYQLFRKPRADVPFGRRPATEAEDLHRARLQEVQDDTEPATYRDVQYRPTSGTGRGGTGRGAARWATPRPATTL